MFQEQVLSPIINSISNFPNRISFYIDGSSYTYLTLAENISKIRNVIQNSSFEGKSIGLITNDDVETYASIIAIWLEGYAYVPIHPGHPIERGFEIIEQANINILIDSSETPVYDNVKVIRSSDILFSEMNLGIRNIGNDELAYILFTSGSTGRPKGVPISRGNLGAFMKAFWSTGIKLEENDRCLQCFDLTFDVAIQAFLAPLIKGASIYTIPHDQIKYSYSSELLEDQELTFSVMAPSMLRFFQPYFNEIDLPYLKTCILTAEASPLKLVEEWSSCVPNAEIFDFYGPTEATIYCTYSKYNRKGNNKQLNGMITIGKPLYGVEAVIIDEKGDILPANQKGELCISGEQVTKGYWKNPERNKTSFIEINYFGKNKRFYRTGDSCYFDDEGEILYAGRLDYQVKIQGHRIELGEIEHHTRIILERKNAVAVVFENSTGNNEIALFVEDEKCDSKKLIKALSMKLPHYMIPKKVILLEQFPVNSNAKVDRIELKKYILS